MTKAELVAALCGVPDHGEVFVKWVLNDNTPRPSEGDLFAIDKALDFQHDGPGYPAFAVIYPKIEYVQNTVKEEIERGIRAYKKSQRGEPLSAEERKSLKAATDTGFFDPPTTTKELILMIERLTIIIEGRDDGDPERMSTDTDMWLDHVVSLIRRGDIAGSNTGNGSESGAFQFDTTTSDKPELDWNPPATE
jgi:hypothetical protein